MTHERSNTWYIVVSTAVGASGAGEVSGRFKQPGAGPQRQLSGRQEPSFSPREGVRPAGRGKVGGSPGNLRRGVKVKKLDTLMGGYSERYRFKKMLGSPLGWIGFVQITTRLMSVVV